MKRVLAFCVLTLAMFAFSVENADAQNKGGSSGGGKFGPSSPPSTPPKSSPPSNPPPKNDPPKTQPTNPPPKSDPPKFGPSNPPKGNDPPKDPPKFGPGASGQPKDQGKPGSIKPPSGNNEKALANKQEASKKKYEEQVKATEPPKPEYKTPDGKTVKIDANSDITKKVRDKPSSYYEPEVRTTRTVTHIETHHYHHPYTYYQSQPVIFVGGGYSSAFWWMMAEWSAERRAEWLYHNHGRISDDAYMQGRRDAEVDRRLRELEARNVSRNPNYIDPEFADNPDLMLEQEYIEHAYNPRPRSQHAEAAHASNENASAALKWVCVAFFVVALVAFLIFLASSVKVSK